MVEVVLSRRGKLAHAADRTAEGSIPGFMETRLDGVLDGVGQLESVSVEELDAVVRHRVMRGRQHDAEARSVTLREVGDRRRGQHTREEYVDPCARETGHHGRLEELAARTGISPDDSARTCAIGDKRSSIAEHVSSRSGEGQREFGGEVAIGESPYAVGAEEATAHGAPISACCTEAPCGPS